LFLALFLALWKIPGTLENSWHSGTLFLALWNTIPDTHVANMSSSSSQQPSPNTCFQAVQNTLKQLRQPLLNILTIAKQHDALFSSLNNEVQHLRQELGNCDNDVVDIAIGQTEPKEAIRKGNVVITPVTAKPVVQQKKTNAKPAAQQKDFVKPEVKSGVKDTVKPGHKKQNPTKICPHCGIRIACACRKCPFCKKSALNQDKRSIRERKRRVERSTNAPTKKLKKSTVSSSSSAAI
tara:strand:+ start:110 stop:820 length:711 start_codon:yes stop_codon:yes gene_type:complete